MKTIEVYGASDDLIEVSASGERGDEFGGGEEPRFLFFADGTVLSVVYGDEGIWRIARVKTGTAEYEHIPGKSADDERYSDTVWLRGDVLCKPGTNTAAPIECWGSEAGPTRREIAERLDGFDKWRALPEDALLAFYRAALAAGVVPQ